MLTLALFRFQRTFRQRRGAYLSLVLLIGLVGGLSMGALAAARRTESSFPTFLATTNPSNLRLATALWNPALGYTTGYNGPLVATIARLPHVRRAESYAAIYSEPIGANGQPTAAADTANFDVNGSVDGLYFNQDRVTVVQGRMADPTRANEIMMTVGAADSLDLHIGQTVTWGTYTNTQFESAPNAPPPLHERLTLVGTVVLNNAVVQDEINADGPATVIFTPALSGGWTTAAPTTRSPTCSSTRGAATCRRSKRSSRASCPPNSPTTSTTPPSTSPRPRMPSNPRPSPSPCSASSPGSPRSSSPVR